MTAQAAETFIENGESLALCNMPLSPYFELLQIDPPFEATSTALWRGYIGTWTIEDDRLYLIKLQGRLKDGNKACLKTLFPDYPNRVFAHWYSGTLRLPEGKLLEYVHGGFASQYERDRFITIKNGLLVSSHVVDNGTAEEGEPEGYTVAAYTTLPHINNEDAPK